MRFRLRLQAIYQPFCETSLLRAIALSDIILNRGDLVFMLAAT
jgi:hypothetical protein